MRRMEQAADALYKSKLIRGFCHLAIGQVCERVRASDVSINTRVLTCHQEAVSVGLESAITKDDMVITAYRCHPFAVLRGGTITGVIGELLGRQVGMSNGKGGSMHIFTERFFGGNGIVGAQVPIGAGIAFAQKYLERPSATFALYGDGASNQGQVFEAFNMAKLWDLPCVFVCENNKYGMGTSANRSSSNTEYFTRGDKIPGIQANGMDIIASAQAVKYARDWVLNGNGPLLLEFVTYRYGGHSCVPHVFSLSTMPDGEKNKIACRTLVLHTVRVRRYSACAQRRTRSAVSSATLKNGASQLTRSLRRVTPNIFFDRYFKRAYRLSTRLPRKRSTKPLRRPRSHLSHELRTSGPTFTTRALSHRLCADVSVRRCVLHSEKAIPSKNANRLISQIHHY